MKISYFIAASAIALFAATSANAADAILAQEPTPEYIPPAFTWSGAYIGAQAGYGWGNTRFESDEYELNGKVKTKGFLGGVFAGYNWEAGNGFLLGAEADVNYANLKKSFHGSDIDEDGVTIFGAGETKLRWEGAVRARVGYVVDRFLPYIAGGVAFGGVKHSLALMDTDGNAVSESWKKTQVGWTAGGGVDYAATDNIFLRLEYRYTDLGKKDYQFLGEEFKPDFKSHEIRLGVAYKF
ncbi:porin family protein [Phyllobacterium salinisoli]|uniref:Porin family protein n=1 Tax=Phyllobacterium salinisoli TaxID=1899321 RepID=A0A368JY15_9HYPH|nr:outer membrane protein [Phyllobacterium salinisoli]RCS21345.1 porin family protein [Phyllobacterium salinisoli]